MNLIERFGIANAESLNEMLNKHGVPDGWKISIINGMWYRSSKGFTPKQLRDDIAAYKKTLESKKVDLIKTLGLEKCVQLLKLADQYGEYSTHCHPDSDAFFCDYGEKGFYLYTGPASIMNAGDGWDKSQLVLINDIRAAVAKCPEVKEFEDFLIAHGTEAKKNDSGSYMYVTRLILEEWLKSPALAIDKIHKLKTTKYYPQGEMA